jgi:2-dehydro-3-deoxyphosphogluconate aldolase/(4S)-4-hydroxy-2-oxoglutarate aldolase
MANIIKEIIKNKIYGVVRADDGKRAVEIATAYAEAGIKVVEMNSNFDAIKEIANKGITVAAGGIITSAQADMAINAGAKLLVSPILQMGLAKFSSWNKIPLILTATTANEAYSAWKVRTPLIKIYPIKDLGGVTYIEDLLRPMKFLNVMPSGSVKVADIKTYLKHGASAVALGRTLYKDKKYDEIVEITREAIRQTFI